METESITRPITSGSLSCNQNPTEHSWPPLPPVEALHTNHQWFTELQPEHDRENPWIRILRLEPGAFGDPLHGRLTVEELDATETFDALSYSCGPPILSCTITVNGTPGFCITRNLCNALQRVRKTDSYRRIWVDAVCIDQDDEKEKSSQVRHMHDVYSRADEVCIYFGECSEQAFFQNQDADIDSWCRWRDPLERMSTASIPHRHMEDGAGFWSGEPCQTPLCIPFNSQQLAVSKDDLKEIYVYENRLKGCTPNANQLFVDEFMSVLEDELMGDFGSDASPRGFWWKRLWTVQELILAEHPVVYCGPYVLLWKTVFHIWTKLKYSSKGELEWSPQLASKMRLDIIYLEALRRQTNPGLHALLEATTAKAFTEPKDRIFALLGLSSPRASSLDYALDSRIINALATIHCVTTQGNFDILFSRWKRNYHLGCEPGTCRLRSCVPNFNQGHDTRRRLDWHIPCLKRLEQGRWESARVSTVPDLFEYGNPERNQSLSTMTERDISFEVTENTASRCRLAFGGTCVTTVSKLYRLGQHDVDWIMADLSKSESQYFAKSLCKGSTHWNVKTINRREQRAYDLYTLLLESCSLHLDGDRGKEIDFKFEAQRQWEDSWLIRKTFHDPRECLELFAVVDECLRRPWDECLTGPLASCRWDWTANRRFPNQMGEVHEVLQILLHAVLYVGSWSGTFFITADGHLGIGPELTQPGDQIVVLDGARSPFVLRALKNSSDYALLGDSFVLGLMHGEVRDMDARGEFKYRKFVIQ